MIERALAFLRAGRTAPVHPITAGVGALCVVLGATVVQRYVQQQQTGLAHAWNLLRLAERDARMLQERWAAVDRVRDAAGGVAGYPAPDDLDPVGRGDQADEPELVDELAGGDS